MPSGDNGGMPIAGKEEKVNWEQALSVVDIDNASETQVVDIDNLPDIWLDIESDDVDEPCWKHMAQNPEQPITQAQMHALLKPLQGCLQRMESRLQEVSYAVLPAKQKIPLDLEVQRKAGDPHGQEGNVMHERSAKFHTPNPRVRLSEKQMNPVRTLAGETGGSLVARYRIQQQIESARCNGTPSIKDRIVMFLEKAVKACSSISEPQRVSWISDLLDSVGFETICQCVIILNAVLLGYDADWQIKNIGMRPPPMLAVLEYSCLAFFIVEVIMRLVVHRLYFFVNDNMGWNILDFIVVSTSLAGIIVDKTTNCDNCWNVGYVRVVRLFKLARILRSLRLFRTFASLSIMVDSLRESLIPLLWSLVLLACIIFMFALAFIQGLVAYMETSSLDPDVKQDIDSKFGSMSAACLSLYKSITGAEDWIVYFDLLDMAGSYFGMLYLFFVAFCEFAVFNLMTGLIVEKAMESAEEDKSERILLHRKKIAEQKKKLLEICTAMDSDGNGRISWTEFKRWMQNPVMSTYLSSIDLDVYDVELFFTLVASHSWKGGESERGQVTFLHFVDGCMQMKGGATAIDMQRQLFETHMLREEVKNVQGLFIDKLHHLERLVHHNFKSLRASNGHQCELQI